jgi:RHS repeat-associated protein
MEPFGEIDTFIASNANNPFRFPGQYEDDLTGLYYNHQRYYIPSLGRYNRPESLNILNYKLSESKYKYVRNSCNMCIDAGGDEIGCLTGGIIIITTTGLIGGYLHYIVPRCLNECRAEYEVECAYHCLHEENLCGEDYQNCYNECTRRFTAYICIRYCTLGTQIVIDPYTGTAETVGGKAGGG